MIDPDGRDGHPVIELSGVHKTYSMGALAVRALRGVDLRIDRGEMVAILGPSGSGKTTLLEILGCLSRPTSGTYRFNGRRDRMGISINHSISHQPVNHKG